MAIIVVVVAIAGMHGYPAHYACDGGDGGYADDYDDLRCVCVCARARVHLRACQLVRGVGECVSLRLSAMMLVRWGAKATTTTTNRNGSLPPLAPRSRYRNARATGTTRQARARPPRPHPQWQLPRPGP